MQCYEDYLIGILKWKVGNIVENNDVMVLGQQGVWSSEVGR
jgi:hypothetical protein